MNIWEPRVGEVLTLEGEPDNMVDQLAVSVLESGCIVGHIPFNLAPVFFHFFTIVQQRGSLVAFVPNSLSILPNSRVVTFHCVHCEHIPETILFFKYCHVPFYVLVHVYTFLDVHVL